jgi:peptide/nickel transport system permease protein
MTDATATKAPLAAPVAETELIAPSPREEMRRRARKHVGFIFGGSFVLFVTVVAILAPLLAPFDPYDQDLTKRLIDPVWKTGDWTYILGTDALGRDYLSRLIYGARISLIVGFGAAVIAGTVGSLIGILGGYFGGRVDAVVMYLINVKLALPGLLIALSLVSIVGGSVTALVLILGFLTWDRYAVVTRAVAQQLRGNDFITAARAVGASQPRVILSELLPNVLNQIIVIASLEIAIVILIEAALSFLGLGIKPPEPSWGLMISEARNFMFFKPHMIAIPGLAIFLLVISINMAGDGLRDITAPEGRN